MMLGDIEPGFTQKDGVYAFSELGPMQQISPRNRYAHRREIAMRRGSRLLPPNARLVIFTGKPDPWEDLAFRCAPWLKEHYV